ncbi:hypothetical protein, partial [Planobispora longispora]|uniref:hypothetical protein n=1 Tax=Planobispora longispora TaxID=28887 RepID=UPI00360D16D1
DLLNRVLDEMHYAFESIADFRPMLGAIDYNPQFVQAAAPADAVIVASFEMHVGSEECIMTFCLPFTSIFPKLQGNDNDVTLSDSQRRTREEAHRNMVAALGTTPSRCRSGSTPSSSAPSRSSVSNRVTSFRSATPSPRRSR